jgi:hypothetical protein
MATNERHACGESQQSAADHRPVVAEGGPQQQTVRVPGAGAFKRRDRALSGEPIKPGESSRVGTRPVVCIADRQAARSACQFFGLRASR